MNVEYERGYSRANKDFKKKIDEKIKDLTELDNMKIDGKTFTIAVNLEAEVEVVDELISNFNINAIQFDIKEKEIDKER